MIYFGGNVFRGIKNNSRPCRPGRAGFYDRDGDGVQHGVYASLLASLVAWPFGQPAVRSLRLLKAESQSSCPHCWFVNPKALGAMPFCALIYNQRGRKDKKWMAFPTPVSLFFEGSSGRAWVRWLSDLEAEEGLVVCRYPVPPTFFVLERAGSFSGGGIQARDFPNRVRW